MKYLLHNVLNVLYKFKVLTQLMSLRLKNDSNKILHQVLQLKCIKKNCKTRSRLFFTTLIKCYSRTTNLQGMT